MFCRIRIGDVATHEHTFTEQEVKQFANIVGDHNPVHFDEAYVKQQVTI